MSTGFTFGAKTTAAPAFGTGSITFGAASQPQAMGFSFGSITATPGATSGLFSTTQTSAPISTAPLFGTAPSTGLFPTTIPISTAPSTTSGLSFGLPASSAAPTTGLSFGLPAATTTATGFSFGQNTNTNVTTSAPTFGLSAPTTTSGGGLSFNLGGPVPTTSAVGLGFGLGATTTTTATSLTTAPHTSAPIGLGGIATNNQAKSTTVATLKEVPPKDQPLPNEILQTVEAFKEMVKQQKQHSSDIARCSVRDFRRVEQEIDHLNNQLHEVECQLQKNRQLAEKLKYDTAKTVQNVEMAQRTHDTPPGLQYENTAPLKFFLSLSDQFERDMQNLKMQIEAADKYVKNHKNPDVLTPQDLSMGMRRLHETFVALAGRLQSVHGQVESQKETYLNIRKHLLQDTSNPFDKLTKTVEFHVPNVHHVYSPPKVATGPTPFNNLAFRSINVGAQQHTPPPPAYPGPSTSTATGFGAPAFGTTLGGRQPSEYQLNSSLFGSNTFGQSSFNSSFQLQKPPTGNKRGKV